MRSLLLGLTSLFLIISCESTEKMTLNKDLSGSVTYSINTSPFLNDYFKDLIAAMSGQEVEDNFNLFELDMIQKGINDLPGISHLEYSEKTTGNLKVSFDFANLPQLLDSQDDNFPLSFHKKGSQSVVQFNLNKQNSSTLLSLISFPQEGADYFLPVEGDTISTEEYLSMVEVIFEEYASEDVIKKTLTQQNVMISINCPSVITSIEGGEANGNEAKITIPVLDLLTLNDPITFKIVF